MTPPPTRRQIGEMTRVQDVIKHENNLTTTFRPRYEGTDPPACRRCDGAGWVFQGFGEDHECEVCEGHGYDASEHQPAPSAGTCITPSPQGETS